MFYRKQILQFLIFSITCFYISDAFSQEITPRGESYISDNIFCDKWCYQDGNENLRFFTLADGDMWAFRMSGTSEENYNLRSYLYRYNSEEEYYYWDFIENISGEHKENKKYTYPCVAFSVNGENYVYAYYKSTEHKDMEGAGDYYPYYYRLYHQTNPPLGEWVTSYGPVEMEHGPEHETDPNKPVYRSAYVEGDTVYLVYDSYIYVYLDEEGFDEYETANYYYSDNSLYVDVCVINSSNNLNRIRRKRIENVMHSDEQHPQQLSGMKIGDDVILLISYDDGYTTDDVHRGGGVLAYNITKGEKIEDRYFETARVLRAVSGSIQGDGEEDGYGNTTQPARFQVFFNHFVDDQPDEVKYFVKTFSIVEDGDTYDVVQQSDNSRQIVGLSNVGDGWGDLMMDVAVKRDASDELATIPGSETIYQDIYLFRNDADKEVWYERFNSDIFRINFSDSSYVESRDFGPANDEKYEGMNRRLWSLVGIYEGAPPMPMNWQRYVENFPDKNATGISLLNETENTLTMKEESGLSVYGKIGVQFAEETVYGFAKYTKGWISSESVSHTVNFSQTISSVLNNGSMGNAVLLWSVPNLARADMSCFPWWAEDDSEKIPGSETSVIWHLAPNDNLVFEIVEMGDPVYYPLFGVNSDNYYPLSYEDSLDNDGLSLSSAALDSLTFERWCSEWTIDNDSRMNIQEKATEHTNTRTLDFVWDASGTDATSSFSETDVESSTESESQSLEITVGTNIGNSKVFSVNLEAGTSLTFSNEIARDFSVSSGYKLYTDKALEGTLITDEYISLTERVQLSCYLFNDSDEDYWYYDILNNSIGESYPEFKEQKPWYLAYVASRPEPYIKDYVSSVDPLSCVQLGTIGYDTDNSIIISYSVSEPDNISNAICIFDVLGRCIKRFPLNDYTGTYRVRWDCTSDQGIEVPKGIYYVLINPNYYQSGKAVIVL